MPLHTFRSSLILSFFLISITVAQDVSLNDFRIRESRYQRWDVTASGSIYVRSYGNDNSRHWGDNGQINLGTRFSRVFNSEDEFYQANAMFGSNLSKNFSGSEYSWDTSRTTNRSEYLNGNVNLLYGSYIIPDEWYMHAGGSFDGQYDLSRYEDHSTSGTPSMSFNKRKTVNTQVTGGIGYGKMRDARAVIVIIRILENLSEEGVLVRPLSNDEIIAMAEQYHANLTTTGQFERKTKHLIGAIISDLLDKGLITAQQSIGYVTGRSIEVFSEQIYSRPIGWKVQTGPSFAFAEYRYSASNNYYTYQKDPNHRWRVSAEYGTALTQSLHFSSTATVDLPVLSWQRQLEARISAALTHEIGERSSASLSLSWDKYEWIGDINDPGRSHYNGHYLYLAAQYVYFLEDNLSFTFGVNYSDNRSIAQQLMFTSRQVQNNGNVNFNIVYRLD